MSCFDERVLARAALVPEDEHTELAEHLRVCLMCQRELAHQRELHVRARALPAPSMSRARRGQLAAAILAAAEQAPLRRRQLVPWLSAATAAIALIVSAPLLPPRDLAPPRSEAPVLAVSGPEELATVSITRVELLEAPPPLAPARVDTLHAQLTHDVIGGRDVLTLAEGVVTVDSRAARDVEIRVAETIIRVSSGQVRVHARRGVLQSVQVIVGAAVIETPGHQLQIAHDTVWLAAPPHDERSAAAFREAWLALRAGRSVEAIAAFDHATDPAHAEDAAYWAAITAQRAGLSDAATRLDSFVRRFPGSPHAAHARALRSSP